MAVRGYLQIVLWVQKLFFKVFAEFFQVFAEIQNGRHGSTLIFVGATTKLIKEKKYSNFTIRLLAIWSRFFKGFTEI